MKSNVRRITGSGSGGGSGGGGGGGSCGRSGFAAASGRIMYGSYASQGEFPWLAYTTAANSACGSTLISDRWMLTAAHCLRWCEQAQDGEFVTKAVRIERGSTEYLIFSFIL